MKSHLIRENLTLHSPEWYSYRNDYVNGSEIGGLLGLSPYSCAARIFNEKIEAIDPWIGGNKHTFFGLEMENIIEKVWKHNDPAEEDSYIKNAKEGRIVRRCKNYGGYIRNPKYPWLSMSLDRAINKGELNLISGKKLKEESPLELKTIDAFELAKWDALPPSYLAQLTEQMIIFESNYSEIALFDSRKNFILYPVEINKEFVDAILETTHSFWYEKVIPAKKIVAQMNASEDINEKGDLQHEINALEPLPDATEAYESFIKEKYKKDYVEASIEGSMEDWAHAVDYNKIGAEIKELEQEKQGKKNLLLKSIAQYEKLTFGEEGYVSNSRNKNGVSSLRIKIKN